MWTRNMSKIIQSSFAVAALSLGALGCGREDSTMSVPWGGNGAVCPAGQVSVYPYGCVPSGSTGSYVTTSPCTSRQVSATQVELSCYVAPAYYSGAVPNVPYLPNAGSVQEAWWGPEVRAGDQVVLVGSLRYGGVYLGSIFGDCNNEQDASSILYGSVGMSYFALPLNAPVLVSTTGTLRFGMNQRKSCYEAGSLYVRVLRNL